MLRAYVGTANELGLACFLPEDATTVQHVLRRRGVNCSQNSACFWVAVHEDVAHQVFAELAVGDCLKALRTLDAFAFDVAPLDAVSGR